MTSWSLSKGLGFFLAVRGLMPSVCTIHTASFASGCRQRRMAPVSESGRFFIGSWKSSLPQAKLQDEAVSVTSLNSLFLAELIVL